MLHSQRCPADPRRPATEAKFSKRNKWGRSTSRKLLDMLKIQGQQREDTSLVSQDFFAHVSYYGYSLNIYHMKYRNEAILGSKWILLLNLDYVKSCLQCCTVHGTGHEEKGIVDDVDGTIQDCGAVDAGRSNLILASNTVGRSPRPRCHFSLFSCKWKPI